MLGGKCKQILWDELDTGRRMEPKVLQPTEICCQRVQEENKEGKEGKHQPNCCTLLPTVILQAEAGEVVVEWCLTEKQQDKSHGQS